MTRTVALIQARMSSTRLPGKVLQPLAGMPAILFMIERVRRARLPHLVAVVTSTDASDDPLADVLAQAGVPLWARRNSTTCWPATPVRRAPWRRARSCASPAIAR